MMMRIVCAEEVVGLAGGSGGKDADRDRSIQVASGTREYYMAINARLLLACLLVAESRGELEDHPMQIFGNIRDFIK
jgi:hypothetical protein